MLTAIVASLVSIIVGGLVSAIGWSIKKTLESNERQMARLIDSFEKQSDRLVLEIGCIREELAGLGERMGAIDVRVCAIENLHEIHGCTHKQNIRHE